jgi:replicative superfamily II helicase
MSFESCGSFDYDAEDSDNERREAEEEQEEEAEEDDQFEWAAFGLPREVQAAAEEKFPNLFSWQQKCMTELFDSCIRRRKSFVVCAPTGAGKSLVPIPAILHTITAKKKKALWLSPFVSTVGEAHASFEKMDLVPVSAYTGAQGRMPPRRHFAELLVCSYEKACGVLNSLIDDHRADEVLTVIVDEIHLLSNSSRGAVLEGLLARLRFLQIPIIAMSATIPNIADLVTFLRAEHFISTWKPSVVEEFIVVPRKESTGHLKTLQIVDPNGSSVDMRRMTHPMVSEVTPLALSPHPVLIFCATKAATSNCAKAIAKDLHAIMALQRGGISGSGTVSGSGSGTGSGTGGQDSGENVVGNGGEDEDGDEEGLQRRRRELTEEMVSSNCIFSAELKVWQHLVGVGVAFHHSGLHPRCRSLIEKAYKVCVGLRVQ